MPKTYSTHVVIPGVHEAFLEVNDTEVRAVFTYKGEVYNTQNMSNRTLESAKEYMDNWAEFSKGLLPNKFGWSK